MDGVGEEWRVEWASSFVSLGRVDEKEDSQRQEEKERERLATRKERGEKEE